MLFLYYFHPSFYQWLIYGDDLLKIIHQYPFTQNSFEEN